MGSALWRETSEDEAIATINIAINYVRTATDGEAVCETRVHRRNRTNAVLRSEVRHGDGELLATAIGTYAIFPRRR
jgi:acyl-coenzyme A thioesterase PaaI-like protein